MTISVDKAIEILHQEELGEFDGTIFELNDAIRLGIAALERLKENRKYYPHGIISLLPGETKE